MLIVIAWVLAGLLVWFATALPIALVVGRALHGASQGLAEVPGTLAGHAA